MTQVTIKAVDDRLALYQRYSGQMEPQGCFISLDVRDGAMTADYNGEIGNAVPMAVYHGIVRRYHLPFPVYSETANMLLEEIVPMAQRVVDGTEIEHDGSNEVAVLSADAEAAEEHIAGVIQLVCYEGNAIKAWDASDWFESASPLEVAAKLGITAGMSERDVEALTDKAEAEYLEPGTCDIINGLEGYLKYTVLEAVREAAEAKA